MHIGWFWVNYNQNQDQFPSRTMSFDVEEIPAVPSEVLKLTGYIKTKGKTVRNREEDDRQSTQWICELESSDSGEAYV